MRIQAYIALTTVITLSTTCMEHKCNNIDERTPLFKPITELTDELHSRARDYLDYLDSTAGTKKPYNIEDFARTSHSQKLDNITHDAKLIHILDLMQRAKTKRITEDFMGKFSYEKYRKLTQPYAADAFTPLVFSYLKRYNLAMRDLSSSQSAYNNLIKDIKTMFAHRHHVIIPYVYDIPKTVSHNNEELYDVSTLDTMYNALYSLFIRTDTVLSQDIYDCLSLIGRIKQLNNMDEKDLGSAILKKNYPMKHFLAIICIYAETYFQTRGDKITPNHLQYITWEVQKITDIAFPDSFDTNLLDTDDYALEELHALHKNIDDLFTKNEQEIQNLADQYYVSLKDSKKSGSKGYLRV